MFNQQSMKEFNVNGLANQIYGKDFIICCFKVLGVAFPIFGGNSIWMKNKCNYLMLMRAIKSIGESYFVIQMSTETLRMVKSCEVVMIG